MKKTFLIIVGIFATSLFANAQTVAPVVTELRQLLKNAQNNFANDLGKKIDEDPATKNVFYEAAKPALEGEAFIVHLNEGQNMFVLNYDCTGDKINKMIPIVDQYMDELNKMVKESDYTGKDYKDKNGKAVTDIRDKAGNLILRYTSVPAAQTIYVYGFTNGSKESSALPGFKTIYFHKANSTVIKQNVFQAELVSSYSSAKTGTINIDTKKGTITISSPGDADKVYKIISVGSEEKDQYDNKTVNISCTDDAGVACTASIKKEYAFTSSNEMHFYTKYANGTGKGYTCDFIADLYQN